jgi:hypothetical protein
MKGLLGAEFQPLGLELLVSASSMVSFCLSASPTPLRTGSVT